MKIAQVVLPIRTRNPLNSSQGTTRAGMFARARERKQQRNLTGLVLSPLRRRLEKMLEEGYCLKILLTRYAPSIGLDDDAIGPSMKSIRDGITDVCGLANDRHPQLTWTYAQERRRDYGVLVEIEAFPAPKQAA